MSTRVCWMAVLASEACWARNVRASLVLYCRCCGGPVSHTVSVCDLLLALPFVILVHLLLAPPALPGAHADKDSHGKQDHGPTAHHDGTQPPPPAEEQGKAVSGPKEDEHNRGDHEPYRGNQAHHSQSSP